MKNSVTEDARERLAGATIPVHLAVIPDGNRRWATDHGVPAIEGHRTGFEMARNLARFCRDIGIHTVTLWAFSTENWRRSPEEVAGLMALYEHWLTDLIDEAIEEEVRIIHLGRLEGLPDNVSDAGRAAGFPDGMPHSLKQAIRSAEAKTASFGANVINVAINYGGADEIQRAVARLLARAEETGQDPRDLDVEAFLDTAGQRYPNPDIVLRTSGEYRSSGFLPLQSAYAEMIFTPKYFPALDRGDVVDVVLEYSARVRRFGG
ncbi:MAG: undecaprenyl diphosphate synthase family protein [Actinomycetota bacterium]